MTCEQRYSPVPVEKFDAIDMDQIAGTYQREVVLDPPFVAGGTERLIGFCGNKPRTLYGYPTFTETQWKSELQNPESVYYVDPNVF